MCDTRGRGVARGKGPEIGNEGGLHCLRINYGRPLFVTFLAF